MFCVIALAPCRAGEVRADPEEAEKTQTIAMMRKLWEALIAFKKERGEFPDYLSDLVPKYFPNADALISPTEKRTGRHGDNGQTDPKSRTSFCYEFSAQKFNNSSLTFRELKERQMQDFGQVLPVVRCFLYDHVLNMACSGDVFESALYWESSDEAKAIMARIGLGPGFKDGEFTTLTVTDSEKHQPIADAEVRLTAREYHRLPLPDRTVRTGKDGTVRVPLGPATPPSRKLTVTVLKAGFYGLPQEWAEGSLKKEAAMELDRGAEIGGIVKTPDGKPLPGAEITVLHLKPDNDTVGKFTETALSTETSGADGRWKCTRVPREFTGIAICVKHSSAWTSWIYSSNEAGPHRVLRRDLIAGTAEILAERAVEIRGKVTSADGKPVADAEITVKATGRKPPHQFADRARLLKTPAPPAPVKTDADGQYSIPWREDGFVTLMVFPVEGTPVRTKMEATSDMSGENIELGKGRVVNGRVKGDNGKPVSGAEIVLTSWDNTLLSHRRVVAKTGADGKFRWGSAPDDSMRVQVRAEGFVSTFTTVSEAADEEQKIEVTLRRLEK